ncbi:MAG TPA: hypothetical protein VIS51_08970 [Solirubrobacterales bacterium]
MGTEKLRGMEHAGDSARREQAITERPLTERTEQALAAARIKPPAYVTKELGERPPDPTKAKAWDRGVRGSRATAGNTASPTRRTPSASRRGASQRTARERV